MTRKYVGTLGVLVVALIVSALALPALGEKTYSEKFKKGLGYSETSPESAATADRPSAIASKGDQVSKTDKMSEPSSVAATETDKMKLGATPGVQRANELIGMKVETPAGKNLGDVREIVLDPAHNRVSYAVLSFGGFLGLGEKYFAVPYNALKIQPKASVAMKGEEPRPAEPGSENVLERGEKAVEKGYTAAKETIMGGPKHEGEKVLVLDVTEEQLEEAPGFDKNNWPNMADPNWKTEISSYYEKNSPTYKQRTAEARTEGKMEEGIEQYRRVSEIVGLTVQGKDNESIGEIEDIIIDLQNGHLAYAILSVPEERGIGEKMAALPWNALRLSPDRDVAMLNADKKMLDAFTFSGDQYPDFTDRNYARRLHEQFDTQPYWETSPATRPSTATGEPASLRRTSPIAVPIMAADTAPEVTSDKPTAMSEVDKSYDVQKETKISGTVMSVGSYHPAKGPAVGQRLRVRTDEGKMVTVHTCPTNFASRKGIDFSYGEKVNITGAQAEINGRPVVLASEIKTPRDTFRIRDEKGCPEWQTPEAGARPTGSTTEPAGSMSESESNQ